MSTLILNPVFSYFSPFIGSKASRAHPPEVRFRDGSASVSGSYFQAILDITVGAALFLLSAIPTLLLFMLCSVLSRHGLANTTEFAVAQLAAQACLGADLLLFLVYCGRTLLKTLRQI